MHGESSFWTFTYNEDTYPVDGSLRPRDLVLFLKRLRKSFKFRYFAVGEYGSETQRAHYHAALFGVAVSDHPFVDRAWGLGFISGGDLNEKSAAYLCGYVTKKMSSSMDHRLQGRHPEFCRMSRMPGLGIGAMATVAEGLSTNEGCKLVARDGDVPKALRHGRTLMPLGRYLRRTLRDQVGFSELGQSQAQLLSSSLKAVTDLQVLAASLPRGKLYAHIDATRAQKLLQIETRFKIFSPEGSL